MKKSIKIISILFLFNLCGSAIGETRFIVKYKPDGTQVSPLLVNNSTKNKYNLRVIEQLMEKFSAKRMHSLSKAAGVQIEDRQSLATGAHLIVVKDDLGEAQVKNFITAVKQDTSVDYIEEDSIMYASSVPTINPRQWDMSSSGYGGDDFVSMWNLFGKLGYTPGKGVVVAVLDTGYTPHPNFISNLQLLNGQINTYGYKFISDCRSSGECPADTSDAAARDNSKSKYTPDGLDLGSFITKQDTLSPYFRGSTPRNSSWHGSHVIGIIASNIGYNPNNNNFMVGGAYGTKIVPVRVLGKKGGCLADITNGMAWAAGLRVKNLDGSYVPVNKNPADVINMSLGGRGPCSDAYQDAINLVARAGAVVVVAAGNESINIENARPAGCNNVISVAAKGPKGLAYYSNYGKTTITAPGGNQRYLYDASGIYSTVWSSKQKYQPKNAGGWGDWEFKQGTSMAAPHVSAAVADLICIFKARKKTYSFQSIVQLLQITADRYDNCYACEEIEGCCTTNLAMDAYSAGMYALIE